jgi:hypothetical protein
MKPSPYAGFDPLRESEMWEERTRMLVMSRISDVPALRPSPGARAGCWMPSSTG